MNQNEIRELLSKYVVVAVVGLSRNPSKESYRVAEYLKKHGFHIVPINPFADEVLDEKCYESLVDLPVEIQRTIEIVDVFRPSEDVLPVAEQVVQLKERHGVPYVFWMQLGIFNEQAVRLMQKANVKVVVNKCMMREHRRLFTHH